MLYVGSGGVKLPAIINNQLKDRFFLVFERTIVSISIIPVYELSGTKRTLEQLYLNSSNVDLIRSFVSY